MTARIDGIRYQIVESMKNMVQYLTALNALKGVIWQRDPDFGRRVTFDIESEYVSI